MDNFFGDQYLNTHLPMLTEEVNHQEVNFIENILNLPINSTILDLPCGYGRHSNLLAKRGYKVTGIDYKDAFIQLAKKSSVELDVSKNVNYILEDMRVINFEQEFDAVINLFTSFGYFDEADNFKSLQNMSKALKKGGKLVIDCLNREWAIKETLRNKQVWLLYPNNQVFMAMNNFDIMTSRWISDQIIVNKGKANKVMQSVRLYSYTEFKFLFNQVGLKIVEVYGDNEKSEYTVDSSSMIIMAEKL
ncbi:MAG: class I SAM-dependent methyltransferase [Candidatus Sericytochromatia bacterium]|nr:class I SAM-dependent methyltransferase [Candidatus Sericytochromatia bacterium]